MADLSVDFAGVKFKNPFVLASAPPTMDESHILRAAKLGWGGAVTKTMHVEGTVDPRPRLGKITLSSGTRYSMNNIELISREDIDYWCEKRIPMIKEKAPSDFVLIASIMGALEEEEWKELTKKVQEAGADMVELNISCPHGSPEEHMGAFIGQDPQLSGMVVKAAKSVAKIPVMPKLTPNVTSPVPIAEALVKNGADAISGINTVESLIGVDIENACGKPTVEGKTSFGGYAGPGIRPIGLRIIAQVAKAFPKIPLSGIGGIENWENAVEYIMVGAKTTQLCSIVMWEGFGVINKLTEGISKFMDRKGYSSIDDMCGVALPTIIDWGALEKMGPVIANVDEDICTGCTLCVPACRDGGFIAIKMEEGVAKILEDRCDGCGLCMVVCPVEAISMTHK